MLKSSHIRNYYMILHLCHQSSKILLKRLPEATGIFGWLKQKRIENFMLMLVSRVWRKA